jgi:hypothetical protein
MSTPATRPNLDAILRRLKARADRLDHELDAALRERGLPRAALELVPAVAAQHDPRALAATTARVERQLTGDGPTWDEIARPSPEALAAAAGAQLMRV